MLRREKARKDFENFFEARDRLFALMREKIQPTIDKILDWFDKIIGA